MQFAKISHNISLARQSLPFRGSWNHEYGSEQNSNFHQMLLVRAEEDPEILQWLKRKQNKFTSPEIQNEMIQVFLFFQFHIVHSSLNSTTPITSYSRKNDICS